jgi:hypothetical protein
MAGAPRRLIDQTGYRIGQFRRALGAKPAGADLALMQALLSPAQQALFCDMSPRDQWHSVQTLRLLPPLWQADREVAVAALLHDAGKGRIRLHERVLFVVLSASPRLLRRLAHSGTGWRGALERTLRHGEAGARLALMSGASERTAALIRTHHHPNPHDSAALALLDADDRA